MADSDSAPPKMYKSIYELYESNTLIFSYFFSYIFALIKADVNNNGRFEFRTLKNVEIDTWIVRIKYLDF